MQCPKCRTTELKSGKISAKNLELDQCGECKGIWFDRGELKGLLGKKAKKNFEFPDSSAISPFVECPRCKVSLFEFCYPGTSTLVDGCEQCLGVWLDGNEWTAISQAREEVCDDEEILVSEPPKTLEKSPDDRTTISGHMYQPARATAARKSKDVAGLNKQNNDEDIPGIKGSLLRMIENTIYRLS